jgi:hypothetical protein
MDFVLPSGSKMTVSESSYEDANALLKALLKAAKGIPLAKDPMSMDVTVLKDALIEAATSSEVDAAIFKCAERAVYENVKVTKALFDDPKLKEAARADYFLIQWHVIEVNCGPFFGKTFSILRERLGTSPFFQPSSSMPTTPS